MTKTRKPKRYATAAVLTVNQPGRMTTKGRKQIAQWLRDRADDLTNRGRDLNDTGAWRCRYYY